MTAKQLTDSKPDIPSDVVSPAVIQVILDPHLRIVGVNPMARRFLPQRGRIIGRKLAVFLANDQLFIDIRDVLRGGETQTHKAKLFLPWKGYNKQYFFDVSIYRSEIHGTPPEVTLELREDLVSNAEATRNHQDVAVDQASCLSSLSIITGYLELLLDGGADDVHVLRKSLLTIYRHASAVAKGLPKLLSAHEG
jgi:hypothetical protein